MDRHPQQIKRERQDKKRHEFNVEKRSDLKTAIKRVLQSTDAGEAQSLYTKAVSTIDKMASKGLLKKNTAARRIPSILVSICSLPIEQGLPSRITLSKSDQYPCSVACHSLKQQSQAVRHVFKWFCAYI